MSYPRKSITFPTPLNRATLKSGRGSYRSRRGTLIKRIDDARPGDPNSSMKTWGIDFGDFGIALIEGIDRAEKSQVTSFVEKHGDHSCQHVAYDCHNLEKFIGHMKSLGGHPRGNVLVQDDGFGILKQMLAKGYASGHAGEATFPEYCERPERADAAKEVESRSRKRPVASFTSKCRTRLTRATNSHSSTSVTWQRTGKSPRNNRRVNPLRSQSSLPSDLNELTDST
jgi:hypothetical protein